MYETVEVPFTQVGNRRCLTDQQCCEMPWLRGFIERFPNCFEYDRFRCVYWYYD